MIVVVGGHSRNIGKTAVALSLIEALPGFRWTALKITQFGHGLCTRDGHACECETGCDSPYSLVEQNEPDATDTGRFRAAGAARSWWLRTRSGALGPAMPAIQSLVHGASNAIIESNSVIEYLLPDLYLFVADGSNPDWKPSARRFLTRADALVISGTDACLPESFVRPRFSVSPPRYASAALAAFVRERSESRLDFHVIQNLLED